MSINKQALREAAEKSVSEGEGSWQAWHEAGQKYPEVFTSSGHIVATVNGAFGVSRSNFIAAANPAAVLALLDELEAAEKRIAELEAREVVLPQRISMEGGAYCTAHARYDEDGDFYYRDEVIESLVAAGIITRIEG